MVIENFSRNVMGSGVFNTYIATGFFATLIFFIFNSHLFTPMEMMFGTIIVTIALKGVSNMMFSLLVLLFNLQGLDDEQQYKIAEERLDLLTHEIQMKSAQSKSANT